MDICAFLYFEKCILDRFFFFLLCSMFINVNPNEIYKLLSDRFGFFSGFPAKCVRGKITLKTRSVKENFQFDISEEDSGC